MEAERRIPMYYQETDPEEMFCHSVVILSKKSRRSVTENKLRRPYYGTRLDRELKDAKDRAKAYRQREGTSF